MVSFNHIPNDTRVPLFYAEVDNSAAGIYTQNLRALIIGQRLAAGTVAEKVPTVVATADQAKTYFGKGSMLARMVEAFRANNTSTQIVALALDDASGGAAAAGELAITGPATANGTLYIYIGGQRVKVGVTSGDSATTIGDAVEAAINAATDLPVTASNTTGTVTLTARNKGTVGNTIDIRLNYAGTLGGEELPAGVAVAITAMASGATDPDIADAITAMGDEPYEYIVIPYTDSTSLDAIGTEMGDVTGRWSYQRQLYGHVFAAKSASASALETFGAARNDPHVSVVGYYDSPTPTYEAAAMLAGQAGGALSNDPARPLQTLPLVGFKVPPDTSKFVYIEKQGLLTSGVATLRYEVGVAQIERCITTYQKNSWGELDISYLDVTTLATLAYVLRFMRQAITQKFPRHKLANDGTRFGAGQAIVTPNTIRAELVAGYSQLESLGLVENIAAFKANLIVERDATDPNRVNVVYPPDLVNQLRVFAVLAKFRLQYAA